MEGTTERELGRKTFCSYLQVHSKVPETSLTGSEGSWELSRRNSIIEAKTNYCFPGSALARKLNHRAEPELEFHRSYMAFS